MALAKPPNRWIARHHPDTSPVQRHQCGSHTDPRGRVRGLRASMPTTNNNDVKMFHVKHLSFTQAEAGENFIEHHLDINTSYQRIKRSDSHT
ncbi:hypothetical protein RV134_260279 [Roseovarius sp. EC-HK134]|nr:hypothetical protein RV134_260279 [Roseovarius sp. EC-HK134]VVT10654.1 hypothetical protein RV420_290494 [Roseovarius sp. EC-SD190]